MGSRSWENSHSLIIGVIEMISWKDLISCIERLEELPNGGGSEIEFCYQGVEYGIVSDRGLCYIGKCPDTFFDGSTFSYSEEQEFKYKTLTELGKAMDIGFSVEECWNSFEEIYIRPDFECFTFEEIYSTYEKANKSKKS